MFWVTSSVELSKLLSKWINLVNFFLVLEIFGQNASAPTEKPFKNTQRPRKSLRKVFRLNEHGIFQI